MSNTHALRLIEQNDNDLVRPDYATDHQESSQYALLTTLFSLGGRNIPLDLFHWMRTDQKRWSHDGAPRTIALRDIGLPSPVQNLFAEEANLDLIINDLLSSSRITRHESIDTNLSILLTFTRRNVSPRRRDSARKEPMDLLCDD